MARQIGALVFRPAPPDDDSGLGPGALNLAAPKRGHRNNSVYSEFAIFSTLLCQTADQLTVINLCCGKIRAHLDLTADAANAAEFDQIEKTVEECARMLQQIEQHDQPYAASAGIARRKRSADAVATAKRSQKREPLMGSLF